MNKIKTQVKRELWENTATFKTAHIVASTMMTVAIVLTFYVFASLDLNKYNTTLESSNYKLEWNSNTNKESGKKSTINGNTTKVKIGSNDNSENPTAVFTEPKEIETALTIIAVIFSALALTLTISYASGALINDRKDNSILFFKSMPVSEWQVVITRLVMGVFGVPLAALLGILCTWIAYILAASLFGYFYVELSILNLWQTINPALLYLSIVLEVLLAGVWILPLVAWIFVAGAWAKKNVIGTALLPILILYMIEKWFFSTHHVSTSVLQYIQGFLAIGDFHHANLLTHVLAFFQRSGLWIGLGLTAIFTTAAVYLRDRRFEI